MFERARIGGVLYNVCDALGRDGTRIDKAAIRHLTDPFMAIAVKDMKKHKLEADQAAAALVVNLVNTLHCGGFLRKLFEDEYEHFNTLYQTYCAFYLMITSRPDYFQRANVMLGENVFDSFQAF